MRRAKAQPAPQAPPDDDRVKVVERREYVQRVSSQPPAEKPPIDIVVAPVEEESGDDLLDFLTELEEEIGLSLRVDRLPQYSVNGKWNKGAAFEFCDNIPVNKSDLKSGAYMSMIRDLFGPAAYRCTLREVGAGIIRSWPIKIAAPMSQPQQRAPGSSVIYQQASAEPLPQRDTLKEFLESLKTVKAIREVFGDTNYVQPVAPVTPTVEREPLQDRIIGAALDAVLKEKPSDAADILRAYVSPPKEDSWGDILKELVKPLAPVLMGALAAFAQPRAPQQATGQPTPQQAPLPQGALPPMPPPPVYTDMGPQQPPPAVTIQNMVNGNLMMYPAGVEPPPGWMVMPTPDQMPPGYIEQGQTFSTGPSQPVLQPDETEGENEMAENELIETMVDMLDDCVRRMVSDPAVIEVAKQKLVAFKANYPALDRLIGMLVTMPPQAVLGFLALQYHELAPLVDNPIAVQVITDLQAAIKPAMNP